MLARNFNRKFNMDVSDILQDNVSDKIYSSILFTFVNLPYRNNSIDIELFTTNNQEYKSYKHHYRFDNGTMIIIKVISTDFIPYGIYARKIINFLIAEFAYKMSMPEIYNEKARRRINLGKNPVDFIEKLTGSRKVGSDTRKSILMQLQGLLNCYMAVATGYKQISVNDDEVFLTDKDKLQFAFVESHNEQLVNHKFDVFNNWQEEIYLSQDLANVFSQRIMPLDRAIYNKIKSPMELDMYQYYTYQNYNCFKKGDSLFKSDWDDTQMLFGRGYAKTSLGIAGFRRDFRKNLESLQQKVNLQISAPIDSKCITFVPHKPLTTIANTSVKTRGELEYETCKPMLDNFANGDGGTKKVKGILNNWDDFIAQYDLLRKFDKSAMTTIKKYFELDAEQTKKTIEYAKTQKPRNMSAYLVAALNNKWIEFNESFKKRLESWQIIYDKLTGEQKRKIDSAVSTAIPKLRDKWLQEQIDGRILTLIYARYLIDEDHDTLLQELTGSRYQTYFIRSFDLFNLI